MIEINRLCKIYGAFHALSDCNLMVPHGEIFGLLGDNGAGKTTLIRILVGFLKPTSGRARIGGFDCVEQSLEVRNRLSYLPAEAKLFDTMRGTDIVDFFASIRRGSSADRSRKLAQRLDLDLHRRVASMSTGMRQKLAIAVTLSANTELIILDEPTANLDPTVRGEVIRLVLEAKSEGRTVLFSSHVMSEVEDACDRVAVMRKGRLVHVQKLDELKRFHRVMVTFQSSPSSPPIDLAPTETIRWQNRVTCVIETGGPLAPLLGWISSQSIEDLRVEPLGLRSVYDRFHAEQPNPVENLPPAVSPEDALTGAT